MRRSVALLLIFAMVCPAVAVQQPDPPPSPASSAPAVSPEEIRPPARSQDFKFSKVDLDLLNQVDAFDKYMDEHGWVFHDEATSTYLQDLGLSLAPKQTPERVTWRFHVLRDPEVNAFALPNGSIYVNSGLLSRMENEAQLAGVLAHEITHVTNRHTYLEYHSIRKKVVALHVIMAAASAAYFAGANYYIVNAMANVLPLIVVSTVFGYSRELEHESDVYAVTILNQRHYDLREFSRGFELLKKGPEVDLSQEPVFWASHPKLDERVKYVSAKAAELQGAATGLRINPEAYMAGSKNAIRHDANLEILLGRPRTALAIAQRLVALDPSDARNYALLGDAYRSLGSRTPRPTDEEQTEEAKHQTRKLMRKMTLTEYDKFLMSEPQGSERWKQNCKLSDEALHKALELDPANADAHRGLGFLYEREERGSDAATEFARYLQLAPQARDSRQVRSHLDVLERRLASGTSAPSPSAGPATPAPPSR